MSGIINSAGLKSGLVGINIGDACWATPNATQTGESGSRQLTPWEMLFNDNARLYSTDTYGIKISLTGTYMVNISIFTEGRSTSTHNYAYFSYNQTTVTSLFCLDDAADDGHSGRMTQTSGSPQQLIAGRTYGLISSQASGTRNIPDSTLSHLGLTLLKIG